MKAHCVNVVVDVKPIYFIKGYSFQNKIYYLDKIYLDKIYLCFAKIKFSKHTLYRSSCLEVLCKKAVLRNFAKFTGKNTAFKICLDNRQMPRLLLRHIYVFSICLSKKNAKAIKCLIRIFKKYAAKNKIHFCFKKKRNVPLNKKSYFCLSHNF